MLSKGDVKKRGVLRFEGRPEAPCLQVDLHAVVGGQEAKLLRHGNQLVVNQTAVVREMIDAQLRVFADDADGFQPLLGHDAAIQPQMAAAAPKLPERAVEGDQVGLQTGLLQVVVLPRRTAAPCRADTAPSPCRRR